MKKRGFTLIELLIVIAIIAILAAIAIPNFLMAQTRSKVTRAKKDMQTLATAIETYYVDYNDYPDASIATLTGHFNNRLKQLTTPIAYISSLPKDPFRTMTTLWPSPTEKGTATYEYVDRRTAIDEWHIWTNDQVFEIFFSAPTKWCMLSPGPDQITSYQFGAPISPPRIDYDPTNGIVSNGDIWRWGP